MTRAVRFSPEAIADIARIYDYIAPRGGERIAAAYVARIYRYCLDLEPYPERDRRGTGEIAAAAWFCPLSPPRTVTASEANDTPASFRPR